MPIRSAVHREFARCQPRRCGLGRSKNRRRAVFEDWGMRLWGNLRTLAGAVLESDGEGVDEEVSAGAIDPAPA